jgi:molybdopterin synthase catalytic subunit
MDNLNYITPNEIKVSELLENINEPEAGAVVVFCGKSRLYNNNKKVAWLEYEAYEPVAVKLIDSIIFKAKKKWNLENVICVHRTGRVDIMKISVVIITSSVHRDDSYSANRYIIDQIKQSVPIWKKEIYADGSSEWLIK